MGDNVRMAEEMNSEGLLFIWENCWGNLSAEWKSKFLADPRLNEILKFPENSIQIAVSKFNKLESILNCLCETSTTEASKKMTVGDVQSKPGYNNAIKRMQLERALEPKIPDQDWWRGK
jgi:hypothetical protein